MQWPVVQLVVQLPLARVVPCTNAIKLTSDFILCVAVWLLCSSCPGVYATLFDLTNDSKQTQLNGTDAWSMSSVVMVCVTVVYCLNAPLCCCSVLEYLLDGILLAVRT